MKSFFKTVLANIVAIGIVCALLVLSFVILLITSSMSGDGKTKINENSVLILDSRTAIIDSPLEDEEPLFPFGGQDKPANILIYDVLNAIEKAKTDPKIKGISIELDEFSAGTTQVDDIRAALQDFKKSGKFVYAYGNMVSQTAYYLGSVADNYYLNPMGSIDLKGLSTQVVFLKDFAEKYGIGIDVFRHGKYKAAVEPYLRSDMSPENEEQLSTLLNDMWAKISTQISSSRKINQADFKTIVDSLYSMIPDNTTKYKLADKFLQKSEYDNIIKTKIGAKSDKDYRRISFSKYVNSLEYKDLTESVAVLYASGTINSGKGYRDIYSENFVKEIRALTENDDVKAVVLRVNSPGGSANASDEILFELQELKKKKPLVVSFGDYAASGGYYISMAADKIYSEANTLTGSIGVFGVAYNFKNLANNHGFYSDIVKTNENADYASALGGVSPHGKEMLTRGVEGTYKRFVSFVMKNRKKTFEEVDAIGGGRVWSGTKAKEIGLVDEIGTLNDAIAFAAQKAKLKEYGVRSFPEKVSQFEQFFNSVEEDEVSTRFLKNKLGKEQYKIYEMLMNPQVKEPIIMQIPYTISLD